EMVLATGQAPIATNNFVSLAQSGFYDGLAVVRAAKDFVIQAGSPTQAADGGPGYTVAGEVPTATPPYTIGSAASAKSGSEPAGTAGSQFFIVTGKHGGNLTPDYALIGSVTKGIGIAKRIMGFAPASGDGVPTRTVVIDSVKITTAPASG